jgi:hypothetical protein
MAISVYKTWIAGEVLTAADLNASFTQITGNGTSVAFPLTANVSFGGYDASSAGSFTMVTGKTLTIPSGSTLVNHGTETHGSGFSETFGTGSTITNNAAETHGSGSTEVFASGAAITINSAATVTNNGAETHGSGSTEVFASGAAITINSAATVTNNGSETHGSGATEIFASGATFQINSGATFVNNGIETHASGFIESFATGAQLLVRGTLDVSSATVIGISSGYSNGSMILASSGSLSNPGLSFNGDPDCGIYVVGTNNIGIVTAGAKAIDIDPNGCVTMPKQPYFISASAGASNVTGDGTTYNHTEAHSEAIDVGNNFNNATGTFTAPVTGVYEFSGSPSFNGFVANHKLNWLGIWTSNARYRCHGLLHAYTMSDTGYFGLNWCVSHADMDAGDTAVQQSQFYNNTKTINVNAGGVGSDRYYWFSGGLRH